MATIKHNIALLEAFEAQVAEDRLFSPLVSSDLQEQRTRLKSVLTDLLVQQRPALEATKGLDWPYRVFRNHRAYFENIMQNASVLALKREALLFLAQLPFPGQWCWLRKALKTLDELPEMQQFKVHETTTIQEKLTKKRQKQFKLRHFCQILKRPDLPHEKGILRIFSLPYIFLNDRLIQSLSHDYLFYIEPPMGVVFRHPWWRAFSALADPCLFGVGGQEDADFLRSQAGVTTTPLAHGDYLDEALPSESSPAGKPLKKYDLVFNATFDDLPRKRHDRMLELLTAPCLTDLRALFIGRGTATNTATLQNRIDHWGLQNRVTVMANLKRDTIPRILAQCRVGVHLSLYENNCRSIYEFFRSDIPVVIASAMAGLNFDIINDQTGVAVQDQALAQAIRDTYDRRHQFSPHAWFSQHSGSTRASSALNLIFKDLFQQQGYRWTTDIAALASSGPNRYTTREAYEGFRGEFEKLYDVINNHTSIPIQLLRD